MGVGRCKLSRGLMLHRSKMVLRQINLEKQVELCTAA